MAVINFEIFKVIGTLSEDKDGWKKQLTCTSWGKYNPKFDLRAWDSEYTSMKKGITLSLEELIALRDLLNESDLEKLEKTVFSEVNVDNVYKSLEDVFDAEEKGKENVYFSVEFLPGQYDQRADSAIQCVNLLIDKNNNIAGVNISRISLLIFSSCGINNNELI